MIFLGDNSAWLSLLVAIIPSYLSYNAGKKKVAVEKEGSAASQWQELYKAMEEDRDGWKESSQTQTTRIEKLSKDVRDLQFDMKSMKDNYEKRIQKLEGDLEKALEDLVKMEDDRNHWKERALKGGK